MVLIPAYGRDYKSAAAVKADFEAGKDFIVQDYFSPYDGKPANKESLVQAGVKRVEIRYARLAKLVVVKVQ